MKADFFSLLKSALHAGQPGHFHLGKGPDCRKVRFDGRSLSLSQENCLLWFPSDPAIQRSLDEKELAHLLSFWEKGQRNPADWLQSVPHLSQSDRGEILESLLRQELLHLLIHCDQGFLFERSSEKSSLEDRRMTGLIEIEELLLEIEAQQSFMDESLKLIPALDEVLIRSSLGRDQAMPHSHWVTSMILDLVDGFREIGEVINLVPFAPRVTREILAWGLQNGLLLKKRFPEFTSVQPDRLSEEDRTTLKTCLENALSMAASPVTLLEQLAEIQLADGDEEGSATTRLKIVETHQHAKRHEEAILALDRIQTSSGIDLDLGKRRQELVIELAKDRLANGDLDEGRRWLREAIDTSDDDQIRLDLIATYKAPSDQIQIGRAHV